MYQKGRPIVVMQGSLWMSNFVMCFSCNLHVFGSKLVSNSTDQKNQYVMFCKICNYMPLHPYLHQNSYQYILFIPIVQLKLDAGSPIYCIGYVMACNDAMVCNLDWGVIWYVIGM
jgi:hypothetical protein